MAETETEVTPRVTVCREMEIAGLMLPPKTYVRKVNEHAVQLIYPGGRSETKFDDLTVDFADRFIERVKDNNDGRIA